MTGRGMRAAFERYARKAYGIHRDAVLTDARGNYCIEEMHNEWFTWQRAWRAAKRERQRSKP